MDQWSEGYINSIEYIHTFTHELLPETIRFAALSKGVKVPAPLSPINYCELGCGQGFAVNLNAAANPQMSFYANDFNAAHIAGARRLAEDAGVDNAHFYDHSFEAFVDEPELPDQFDIIALHGIWAWVRAEHRQQILTFVRKKLKVGGLVYLGYNAMPGWASVAPLRHLMRNSIGEGEAIGKATMQKALESLRSLEAVGSAFLDQHPLAKAKLEGLAKADQRYLVHEYLNESWQAFYFDEVAADLGTVDCTFIESANPTAIVQKIGLTQPQRELLKAVDDPIRRELVQDMLINRRFRRDVFCREADRFSVPEWIEAWRTTRFTLLVAPDEAEATLRNTLAGGRFPECAALFIRHFGQGAALVGDLVEHQDFAAFEWPQRMEALIVLVAFRLVQPCAQVPDEAQRAARVARLNAVIGKRGLASSDWKVFTSPVTGGGVKLNRLEQLFLSALLQGEDDPVGLVRTILQQSGEALPQTAAPGQEVMSLDDHYILFRNTTLERLRILGIAR